jgi:hypothetical protein
MRSHKGPDDQLSRNSPGMVGSNLRLNEAQACRKSFLKYDRGLRDLDRVLRMQILF